MYLLTSHAFFNNQRQLSSSTMAAILRFSSLFLIIFLLHSAYVAKSESFIGVNYGQVADNLPPPSATVKLLQSTAIEKVRLYGVDPAIIKALSNSGIGIMIGASNGDIPAMASDPNFANNWINTNVIPFYPASNIILITVGNEVMFSGDRNLMSQLLPAMHNLQNALNSASLGGKIKVSTVHSMNVLRQSDPPSSGSFDPSFADLMKGLLEFNKATGSPFPINPYPFFAYRSDPRPETLAFCLFQPNSGRVDSGTKIKYTNMFDAQVDAVRSALNSAGFKDVEIVIAETGWPYKGDSNEVGPSIENARAYTGNLIAHLRSMVGTPLMPGKSVDTYLFALYDEDLKSGPTSERSFGLFKPDLTMTYDAGLSKTTQTPSTPKTPVTPSPKAMKAAWCVPKAGVSDAQLQTNLDYACGQGIDCSPIQPGGACFDPNTLASHATFAMNLLYQTAGRNPWNCDFSQTATLSSNNPNVITGAFTRVEVPKNRAIFFQNKITNCGRGSKTDKESEGDDANEERDDRCTKKRVVEKLFFGTDNYFEAEPHPRESQKRRRFKDTMSSYHSVQLTGKRSGTSDSGREFHRKWRIKATVRGHHRLCSSFPLSFRQRGILQSHSQLGLEKVYVRMCHSISNSHYMLLHLEFHSFGLGFMTSITFILLVGIFMSSWLGSSLLALGEWLIKKMPLVSYIYAASKQISAAISPDQSSNVFKEVAIIRHPRIGEYAFGFITSNVILRRNTGDEEFCCVYVPSNHLYLGDIFLVNSNDIMRPNLSVRECIEIVISGGMSIPKILTTEDASIPTIRIGNFAP
ncbi:unnamed protein product [Camellia sinensis]